MGLRRAFSFGVLLILCAQATRTVAEPPAARSGPPSWAADAVWYAVAVDRFKNGDPRNDPRPADLRGAWPVDPPRDWQLAPWTSSWYTLLPGERASGRDFYTAVFTRRYGGDLAGILERLDHLQGLGVNALLLSPVFEAPSALKGDPTFLHHVDNNFGPDPEGDRLVWATENPADPATWKWTGADRFFLRLVQECHRRQIKVVLETAFPFVGQTFWAFRDVRARGAASKYAAWFEVTHFDNPATPTDELQYEGLYGARDFPAFKKDGEGLAAGPREHLKMALKRWSDPNGDGDGTDGVDGFLFLGAERLGPGFWGEIRRYLLGLNPEAMLIGGFSFEDEARTRPIDPTRWLSREGFDAALSPAFAAAARAFFLDRAKATSAAEFDALLSRIRGLTRPETALALLNPIDGPDGERAASRAVNPDREPGVAGSPKDNPRYDVRAPRPDEWKRLRLLAAFQFVSPGAPVVSYGTETGLWGAADPDALRPMLWRDLRYEDDAGHPLGQARKPDPVRFDEELYKFYQALGRLRGSQPALRRGSFETVLADEGRRVYAFVRILESERVAVAFNLTEKEQALELPLPAEQARDLLSGRRYRSHEGKVTVSLPPLSAVVLAAEGRGQ
jgi:glycosidase